MEPKWQRIRFMPATPLGADGTRVTGCEAHIALSRRAATEGMVLLKNENETLPLKHGTRVAVFGKAQADYVKGGGGSGDTTVAYVRSRLRGFASSRGRKRSRFLSRWSPVLCRKRQRAVCRGCDAGQNARTHFERRTREAGACVYGYRHPHHLPLLR